MTNHRVPILWRLACLGAILLFVLTFTPLVTDPHDAEPRLWGMPHTLWAGILVGWAYVLLTWIGTRVHPARRDGRDLL